MTVVEIPSGTHAANRWLGGRLLGGRFRLDERISLDDQVIRPLGPRGSSWEARGLSLWKASDQLLGRPVTIYLLPPGPVPRTVIEAVQSAAKVTDPRLAAIYDTDFNPECPYIVSEWAPGTPLEDLVLTGRPLPHPALAAAMIADAADALAVAHQARRPHLRLTPRSLRWDPGSGLKITGLGLDAALCGDAAADNPVAADTTALARMLYALLTGYWPGDEAQPTTGQPSTGQPAPQLPRAPRHKGRVCTPRQVRAGVPAILDAITYRALHGQAADAPLRAQTPAGLAMALRMVQRPSYQMERPGTKPAGPGAPGVPGRHARASGSGSGAVTCGTGHAAAPRGITPGGDHACCRSSYLAVSRVRTRSWPSASSTSAAAGRCSSRSAAGRAG